MYATVEAWRQAQKDATVAEIGICPMTISTNRESERFMLRLPDGMRDRIKAAAEANNRSMNAEIVAALTEKFPEPTDPEFEKFYEMAQRIAPKDLKRVLVELIDKDIASGKITNQDLEDGIVPGLTVIRVPKAGD